MARRVVLVCIDPWEETTEFQPFNYSARRVQAALRAAGVEAHVVDSRSREIEPLLERIEALEPDIVGMSTYVWSFPLFVELAQRLKERAPQRLVIFGGPSARTVMFDLPPFREARVHVDALIDGEGENVIVQLAKLPSLDSSRLLELPGVSIPTALGWRKSKPAEFIEDLSLLPSPYALDLVPRGITAHLETFRGCPLSCSFCQWGDGAAGARMFSVERIVEDLEHFRRLGLSNAILVDAALNLNSRAFRALVEAERQTRVLRDIALSFEVYPSQLKDEHLTFLSDIRVNSIGVGLQSYDPAVTKRLERTFDPPRFERVVRDLANVGGQVTIEIIMGLPGDTPDSFRRTLAKARELPCDVRVFHCLVLPDALLSRAPEWAAMEFDPVSLLMQSCAGWSKHDIASACEELSITSSAAGGWGQGSFWLFPRAGRAGTSGPEHARAAPEPAPEPVELKVEPQEVMGPGKHEMDDDVELYRLATKVVSRATRGKWALRRAIKESGRCLIVIDMAGQELTLELTANEPNRPAFLVVSGVAITHRMVQERLGSDRERLLRTMMPAFAELFHRTMTTIPKRQLPIAAP